MRTFSPDKHVMTSKNRLILFAKNPEKGKVKTRLAKSIGDDKALEIYHALVLRSADICKKVDADRVVYYTSFTDPEDAYTNPFFDKKLQVEGNLGDRMCAAFAEEFKLGYNKVLIVGSDCYDLTEDHIHQAFKLLDTNNVVIGPANDGGYYLLGMYYFVPQLFEEKSWSTPKLIEETKATLASLNLSVAYLEELTDLDEIHEMPEALKHLL